MHSEQPNPREHAVVMIEAFSGDRLFAWLQALENRRGHRRPADRKYWEAVAEAIASTRLRQAKPESVAPSLCQEYYRPPTRVPAGT